MRNDVLQMINEINGALYSNRVELIKANVVKNELGYTVEAFMPGVVKENINVEVENGILTIKADKALKEGKYILKEMNSYPYYRSFDFDGAEFESITAKYNDGILKIELELKKEEKVNKKIVIE